MNDEDHVLLSEKLEDQLKAVEWAHEQKKILDDKSRRIADALMEKMIPLIMKNSVQKQSACSRFENTLTRHKTSLGHEF